VHLHERLAGARLAQDVTHLSAAEQQIRTMSGHFAISGEGLCIGYDSGDAVTSDCGTDPEFSGGKIVRVVFDVADDVYIDVERHVAAAMMRD
jgi:hypothetical protein